MVKDIKEKKEEVKEEVKEEEQQPGPQLTVQDLALLRSCIELGSQRGAWRAGELTQVGAIYEKLSSFLQTLLPPKDAEEKETDTADKGETKND